ncbi:hypothetical protein T492DRAFT_267861 [Pavlovales sp. CCMP2436]|nr:hypothetical protein T492DRAFT_267861 [Pavlovales sp. CCMP2436]
MNHDEPLIYIYIYVYIYYNRVKDIGALESWFILIPPLLTSVLISFFIYSSPLLYILINIQQQGRSLVLRKQSCICHACSSNSWGKRKRGLVNDHFCRENDQPYLNVNNIYCNFCYFSNIATSQLLSWESTAKKLKISVIRITFMMHRSF